MEHTRRGFLAGLATAGGWLAGCSGVTGQRTEPVQILAAGSLQTPLGDGLSNSVSIPITVESHGSAAVARLVADRRRDPDILALADTALFTRLLDSPWYASFATNELVVAHADSAGGRSVARADHWFTPIATGDARLGRTDPDLDPLGYRTLFMLQLAADYYDEPGLQTEVLRQNQIYPETALAASFESSAIDAAILYRSMATQHDLDVLELPPAIDLGSPEFVDEYTRASYELDGDTTVTGGMIEYGATLRQRTPATETVFENLLKGDYLMDHGFERPDEYPRYTDDAPSFD